MSQQLKAWWPVVRDRSWTLADALVAAATYRGAVAAGVGEGHAAALAEAAGYKNLYKGLMYPDEIERGLCPADIKSRVETS